MTDFEWLDSGPNCSEGHYSIHSKIRTQVPPYIPPKLTPQEANKVLKEDVSFPFIGSLRV